MAQSGMMWRFVRASMSILGLFPPISDESQPRTNLLVDGAYCDNVPSDVMCSVFHPHAVITVNVEGYPDEATMAMKDTQSGFTLFFKQLFPRIFGSQLNQTSIQQRLMYTWSENRRGDNLLFNSDVVIRPPLRDVYLTDNSRFDEIEARGYKEGKKRLQEWIRLIPQQTFGWEWVVRHSPLFNALFVVPKYPFKEHTVLTRASSAH